MIFQDNGEVFSLLLVSKIYCVAVKINKAWNFIIDSRFLIHRFECTMVGVLRFSIVRTSYRIVKIYEDNIFMYRI